MPISTECPSCAARVRAPDSAAGKKVKCPKCQKAIPVPAPPSENEEPEEVQEKVAPAPKPKKSPAAVAKPAKAAKPPAPADDEEDPDPPAREKSKKGGKEKAKGAKSTVRMPLLLGIGGGVLAVLLLVGGLTWWFFLRDKGLGPVVVNKQQNQSPNQPNDGQNPKPKPTITDADLEAETQIDVYSYRPPKGYVTHDKPGPPDGSNQVVKWETPHTMDETPAVIIAVMVLNEKGTPRSSEQALADMVNYTKSDRTNMKQETLEPIQNGGLKILQVRWSGTNRRGVKEQGSYAIVVDGTKYVAIDTSGREPDIDRALALAEAMAKSLHKK